MKDTDKRKIGLSEVFYALDLCLHHSRYVNGKYRRFQLTNTSINILYALNG